jgi:amino acid permease
MFKFHMRVYFLVAVFPDCRRNRAAVYYNAEIAKAKKPCVLPLVVAACVMLLSVCVKLTRSNQSVLFVYESWRSSSSRTVTLALPYIFCSLVPSGLLVRDSFV